MHWKVCSIFSSSSRGFLGKAAPTGSHRHSKRHFASAAAFPHECSGKLSRITATYGNTYPSLAPLNRRQS